MKAVYNIDNTQINNMQMTISITMSVREWRDIIRTKSEAKAHDPFHKVQNMISTALGDLTNATEKRYSVNEFMKKDIE